MPSAVCRLEFPRQTKLNFLKNKATEPGQILVTINDLAGVRMATLLHPCTHNLRNTISLFDVENNTNREYKLFVKLTRLEGESTSNYIVFLVKSIQAL